MARRTLAEAEREGYFKGYQEALRDVAEANERSGVSGLAQWISDNSRDESVRKLIAHLIAGNL